MHGVFGSHMSSEPLVIHSLLSSSGAPDATLDELQGTEGDANEQLNSLCA